MADLKKHKIQRTTRAYLEGYIEGRVFGRVKNRIPYSRTQEINDFQRGFERGMVLADFQNGTPSATPERTAEVKKIRIDTGEKLK